ncbi:MAG: PP2C family protein-serine/threonine phosphatase [Candidatus Aminicenantes bacterium]|nr:MAG: PP2C family protein-serine/threonine phosphatase [Candidatus Aminicenantes bacterium]
MKKQNNWPTRQNKNRFIESLPLMALGTIGLLAFILLLNRFFPYKAANLNIGKSEAIEIASNFMTQKGYDLKNYEVLVLVYYDNTAFHYLQKRLGWSKTQEIFQKDQDKGLDFYWQIFWFKNLPRSSTYEQFRISISGTGRVIGFSHDLPEDADWPEGRQAHITRENALEIAATFLKKQNIDLTGYKKDNFHTQRSKKRTNHSFNWRKELEYEGGKVNLTVVVQGDEVGRLRILFGVPASETAAFKRIQEHHHSSVFVSYFFIFIIFLVIQIIFLRRYHEGEVSVKTALVVLFICWVSLVIESSLKFRLNAASGSLGELSVDSVGLMMLVLFGLIIWPFFSSMGFASWSVGEFLGREKFNRKFTALDSIFNKKFTTLNVARSSLNGYLTGFIGLGIIALLTTALTGLFNGKIDNINYRIMTSPLPFLVPFLSALSFSLLSEVVFRLFGNFLLFKYLKSKWAAIFVSSIAWTVFVIAYWGLWGVGFSISPMILGWIGWYICGVFLGYIFWKFDLLSAIFANFTIMGVIQSLPLITSSATSLFVQGMAALILLFLPVVFIVWGFIKGEIFSFKADLIPAHIKRITERARIAKELEIARQVQQKLLPGKSPKIKGFEIEGICIPANEVGGDYYDFIRISDPKLGIIIGDVSGKGVPAAIYMTLTKGIIQSQIENKTRFSPEQVLIKTNHSLYNMMDKKSFVTMFFAVVDIKKKTLDFARAGHNPLLYFHRSDNQVISLKPQGIALGIERGDVFQGIIKKGHIQLEKDDLIVFYTDGFSEAMNKDLEEYGEKRLCRTIQQNKEKPARVIIDTVIKDVQQFVKGYPQHDDMTMVIVKVL